MRRNILSLLSTTLLVCCLAGIVSCKKSADDEAVFSWTYKGVNNSAKYMYILPNEVISGNFLAGTGDTYPPSYGMTGKILPLAIGTHTIGQPTANDNWIFFTDRTDGRGTCTGTVTITAVANNKLSGNFTLAVTLRSGQVETLTGVMKNVPMLP